MEEFLIQRIKDLLPNLSVRSEREIFYLMEHLLQLPPHRIVFPPYQGLCLEIFLPSRRVFLSPPQSWVVLAPFSANLLPHTIAQFQVLHLNLTSFLDPKKQMSPNKLRSKLCLGRFRNQKTNRKPNVNDNHLLQFRNRGVPLQLKDLLWEILEKEQWLRLPLSKLLLLFLRILPLMRYFISVNMLTI